MGAEQNPATNRITTSGYGYDDNGNLTAMPLMTMSYNVDNRLIEAMRTGMGTDHYVYDPRGQRVWKKERWCTGVGCTRELVYFYGVEGNLLLTHSGGMSYKNVYFGRRQVYHRQLGNRLR